MTTLKHKLDRYIKMLDNNITQGIYDAVKANPGISQKGIIIKLRYDNLRKAQYVIARLVDVGAIFFIKEDKTNQYFIHPDWEDHLAQMEQQIDKFRKKKPKPPKK